MLVRENGSYLYTFTSVVDDIAFGITTSGDLPGGRVGTPYNQTLSAPGCVNCNWTIAGAGWASARTP